MSFKIFKMKSFKEKVVTIEQLPVTLLFFKEISKLCLFGIYSIIPTQVNILFYVITMPELQF